MVAVRIKKTGNHFTDTKMGEWICEALKGNKAFVDCDILVNYDGDPSYIIICLGENNDRDLHLDVGWPYQIGRPVQRGREESE